MAATTSIEIKNLFDKDTFDQVIQRINKLQPESQRQWGKMNVAQMLTHLTRVFKVPLSDKPIPRIFIGRLFGWAFKKQLYNEKPFKQGLPTAPSFKVTDEREFEKEKRMLLILIEKFHRNGPEKASRFAHPLFGRFSGEQWGKALWKHVDHHLRQFGV